MSDTKRSRSKSGPGDYAVGYGRPPLHSRFAPGQCGNPKGRPKGARNFATDVKDMLNSQVKVTRDGKPRKISTQQALLLRLKERAFGTDARALDRSLLLAKEYNSDEMVASDNPTANDTDVLETYNARLLKGATASNAPEGGQKSAANPPTTSADTAKSSPLKKARPSRHSPAAPGEEPSK